MITKKEINDYVLNKALQSNTFLIVGLDNNGIPIGFDVSTLPVKTSDDFFKVMSVINLIFILEDVDFYVIAITDNETLKVLEVNGENKYMRDYELNSTSNKPISFEDVSYSDNLLLMLLQKNAVPVELGANLMKFKEDHQYIVLEDFLAIRSAKKLADEDK